MTAQKAKDLLLNHPLNHGIQFDEESHSYTRHFENRPPKQYYGITSLLKEYAPFDAQGIKWGIVNSKKPEYAHLNTIEDVEAEWQAARDYGKKVHKDVELWGEKGEYVDTPEMNQVIAFFKDSHLTPIAFEHVMYCDTLERSTPIDIWMFNEQTGKLVPGDFKTSKEIKYDHYSYKGNKDTMEYPLTHLPTANFYTYSLQIAFPIDWARNYYFPDGQIEVENSGWIFHIRDRVFTPHRTIPMQREINMIYEWQSN